MKKLDNVFKPISESFQYTVRESIKNAQLCNIRQHKSLRHPIRLIVVAVLIIAIIPTSVFAGTRLFSTMKAEKKEKGVTLEIDANKETKSPKYVKLNVKVPKGYELAPHTEKFEEFSYIKSDDPYNCGFKFFLSRPIGKRPKEMLDNVEDYKETVINGRQAVVSVPVDKEDYTRVAIYFEDVNIILITFLHPEMTKDEKDYIINNVSVIKGTKEDHTNYVETENVTDKGEVNNHLEEYDYKIFPIEQGTLIDFGKMYLGEDKKGNSTYEVYPSNIVSNIRVVDNIKGLDENSFNTSADDYADKDGNILPHTFNYSPNDDGNTVVKMINQKLVLADITLINNENKKSGTSLEYHLDILTKDTDGELRYSNYYSKNAEHYDEDDYPIYIYKPNDKEKDLEFRSIGLKPNETKKVTVGFLCDEDQLSNAYISVFTCFNEDAMEYGRKYRPSMMYFSTKVVE